MVDFIIKEYETLNSTQTKAKELLSAGDVYMNTVVFTNIQTNGKGKNTRTWGSDKGDLKFTLIIRPKTAAEYHPQITYIAAVAVNKAIKKCCPDVPVQNKWVNDVLLNGRKISGILLERYGNDIVLIGIGVNILSKQSIAELHAIGLMDLGSSVSQKKLLQMILDEFFFLFTEWESFGFSKIKKQWLDDAVKLGEEIKVMVNNDAAKSGIFVGIDDDGNLQLNKNGKAEIICAGDVFF